MSRDLSSREGKTGPLEPIDLGIKSGFATS